MSQKAFILTPTLIGKYMIYLKEQERSRSTIQKYAHDLTALLYYMGDRHVTKAVLVEWKEHIVNDYAPATVNSILAAVNGLLRWLNKPELIMKPLRIQRSIFMDESKELSYDEYVRLLRAAERQNNERLLLVIQTICATGIRVSELKYITAEAVLLGRAEVNNKGKHRIVFLPDKLRYILKRYLKKCRITAGPVFITRTGKPLDRSNIWRDMKTLSRSAGVAPNKIFPHNLRHLFARTYYTLEHDLSRLADILGHSNINTTRIYTAESGIVHAKQLERLRLVIT